MHRVGLGAETKLDLYTKPRKFAKTKIPIEKARLVLVPEATTLKILDQGALAPGSPAPSGHWEVVVVQPPAGFDARVFLCGGGRDSVSAFWNLETVDKEEGANMEVLWFQVSSLIGADPVGDDPRGVPGMSGSAASSESTHQTVEGWATRPTTVFSKASGTVFVAAPPTAKAPPPHGAPALPASGGPEGRKRLASLALASASDKPEDRVVSDEPFDRAVFSLFLSTRWLWRRARRSRCRIRLRSPCRKSRNPSRWGSWPSGRGASLCLVPRLPSFVP